MKLVLNAQYTDLLFGIRKKTGMGISQIIYAALREFAEKNQIIVEDFQEKS